MPWRIVILHFKFETTSKVLGNFAHSVSWNISELHSFEVFFILSLPLKVFPYFTIVSNPSQISVSCHSIYFESQFHFQHYHFSFLCCTFTFTGQFPLLIIHFVKCLVSLSLGKRRQHSYTFTVNWIPSAEWPVIDRLWKSDVIDHLYSWSASIIS